MKKSSITILFIALAVSLSIFAQTKGGNNLYSGGHDSLLFDGSDKTLTNFQNKGEYCFMKVVNVKGDVTGTIVKREIINICDEIDTMITYEKTKIKSDLYDLAPGDAIKTGKDGLVVLELNDGTVIALHNNTSITLPKDYCKKEFNPIALNNGAIKIVRTGDKTTDIGTNQSKTKNKKTQFSVETLQDGDVTTDILKVYEGSVTFGRNMENEANKKKSKDKDDQMKKLADDYQSGKISTEEFARKMQEIQSGLTESIKGDEITVSAGFQSSIKGTDKPTDPVPIGTNEKSLWDDPIFNK